MDCIQKRKAAAKQTGPRAPYSAAAGLVASYAFSSWSYCALFFAAASVYGFFSSVESSRHWRPISLPTSPKLASTGMLFFTSARTACAKSMYAASGFFGAFGSFSFFFFVLLELFVARFFGTFGAIFQKSEEELVALNREFAGFYVQALEAQGLSTAGVGAPEGYDSGWMPFGAYFSLGMSYDHTPALARITCPVLIVHGARDIGMGREALAPYETIENATVAVIPDAGHFAFDERPVEFAGLLKGDAGERESGD